MMRAFVSEARGTSVSSSNRRKGEEVIIMKDSRPGTAIQPVDASDLEPATRMTHCQVRRFIEMTDSAPAKTFRSAAAAVRFLKHDHGPALIASKGAKIAEAS